MSSHFALFVFGRTFDLIYFTGLRQVYNLLSIKKQIKKLQARKEERERERPSGKKL